MLADYRSLIDRQLPPIERGCTSKATFGSRREARSVARHGRHQDGTLHPYHCRYCGAWHVGHRRGTFGRNPQMHIRGQATIPT